MDLYREINDKIKSKDERVVIAITREYVQCFVEDNFNRRLTNAQLSELSFLAWDWGDEALMNWLYPAVKMLIDDSKQKRKK